MSSCFYKRSNLPSYILFFLIVLVVDVCACALVTNRVEACVEAKGVQVGDSARIAIKTQCATMHHHYKTGGTSLFLLPRPLCLN